MRALRACSALCPPKQRVLSDRAPDR
ncbi:uncharacterized protein SOCE26_078460 [Sorangium cellulosum]|uniref:Uncharacterized protein n=1 Tax=Sorangium cellulosum TaxID=56 RepID=A0A2L0F446_SORCE|nr:uncharacterized protein SOCE26_078460 [Sorangium cellulosum]